MNDPPFFTRQLNLGDTPHTLGPWGDEAIEAGKPENGKRCTNDNFTKLGDETDGFVGRVLWSLRRIEQCT